jgi:hypothetical protein
MKVHSAVGGRLGITREEIGRLVELDPKDFEYREWLALKYAQDWILLGGREPDSDYMNDFRTHYTGKERARILKLIRMMRLANLWNNTMQGRPWRTGFEAGSSCSIDGGGRPQ